MKMKIRQIIFMVCIVLFSNCFRNYNSRPYDPSQKQFDKQLKLMYDINIVDFFPNDYNNLTLNNEFGSYHSSSWDDSNESIFRCCAYYSKKVSVATMDSLEKIAHIEKVKYNKAVFTIDIPNMRHVGSYRNTMKDSLQIPIANMRYSFFSLGETNDTIIIENKQYIEKSEVIPNDLVVYVFEAKNGNYWKNKLKASNEERPVLSDYWKHGYVKGVAVSRSLYRVCWWAMAW